MVDIQAGMHWVEKPEGAHTFRRLDLQQLRAFRKRTHEETGATVSYDAIREAQATQEEAKKANKALDAELRDRKRTQPSCRDFIFNKRPWTGQPGDISTRDPQRSSRRTSWRRLRGASPP